MLAGIFSHICRMMAFAHDGSGLPKKGGMSHWLLAIAVLTSTVHQIASGIPVNVAWCLPLIAYSIIGIAGEILAPEAIAPLALAGIAGSSLQIITGLIPDEASRGWLSVLFFVWSISAGISTFNNIKSKTPQTGNRKH